VTYDSNVQESVTKYSYVRLSRLVRLPMDPNVSLTDTSLNECNCLIPI
jgi:hypothetical protein